MTDRDIYLQSVPEDVRENLAFARWQENNRIGTHADGCHTWGIGHYACALRRITELAAQLADAIDDAHREARELDRVNVKLADAKKDDWIPVSERLPEHDNSLCVVFDPDNEPTVWPAKWDAMNRNFSSNDGWFELEEITHWMPLPKSPKDSI